MLCPTQYEFRPKQSTFHAILDIVPTCLDYVENKKFTGLLLLDLKAVNHPANSGGLQ